jgi:AbrB family looped-hinge helix DNA binding protein
MAWQSDRRHTHDGCHTVGMSSARIYKKGQITIPKAVREAAGFNIGDLVVVEARDNEIVLRHPIGVLEFKAPARVAVVEKPWPEVRRAARQEHADGRLSASD